MYHLYPGITPLNVDQLSPTQLRDLAEEIPWLLYMRDRAVRDLHFMQIDKEALAQADLSTDPDPITVEAQRRFLAAYALPDFEGAPPHRMVVRDVAKAMLRGPLPSWALRLLTENEVQAATREVEEARK